MKISSVITTISLSLVIVAFTTGCDSRGEREEKYLDRAQEWIEQDDLIKARLEVRNALQINNESAKAYYLRGLILEREENYRKVMDAFNASAAADPTFLPAQLKRAYYYFNFGPAADSVTREVLDSILAVEPNNIEALVYLGRIALRQGNIEEAIKYAEQAKATDASNSLPALLLAEIYQDDPGKALNVIKEAIAINPGSTELELARIRFLSELGEIDQAIQAYEELIATNPDDLQYYRKLISFLKSNGRNEKVEKLLRTSVADNPDVTEYKYWLAQHLLSTNQQQEAIDTAKNYIATGDASPELYYLLSDIYLNLNDPISAQHPIEQLVSVLDENSADAQKARNHLAEIALQSGDIATAQSLLDTSLALDAEDSAALVTSARLALMKGDTETAIINLRSALKRDPDSVQAAVLLARAHEANGSTDLALDNYKLALQLDPGKIDIAMKTASIYYDRGDDEIANRLLQNYLVQPKTAVVVAPALITSFTKQKKWIQALEVATQLEQQAENQSLGLYFKGGIFFEQKEFEKAINIFEQLLGREPGSAKTLSALAKAITASSSIEDTETYLLAYVKEHPNELAPLELLASLYIETGDIDEARAKYKEALVASPDNVSIYIAISELERRSNNMAAARDNIDKAIAISGKNSGLLILKAGLYESEGNYDAARRLYESVLEEDPKNGIAANNLAMILVDHQASEQSNKRALEITEPFESASEPVLVDTRGWVLYKAGEYERARLLLERAVADTEKVIPVYRFHLGMTYYKLGDKSNAKEQLMASLEGESEFVGKDEAQRILDIL